MIKNKQKIISCQICNKEVSVIESSKRKMCSLECVAKYLSIKHKGKRLWKHKDIKPLAKFNCLNCGKEKEIYEYRLKIEGKYCSRQCAGVNNSKPGNTNPNWRGGKEKQCPICSSLFWVKPSHYEKRITCSIKCSSALTKQTGKLKGSNNPAFGKDYNSIEKIKVNCMSCGNAMDVREKYLKRVPDPCCSKTCRSKYQASIRDLMGENNPNWHGGISFFPYPQEFNIKLKNKIKKLDGNSCVKCGKTEQEELLEFNKRLAIHHIDYNKENCNEDNLTVTCLRCNSKANSNRLFHMNFFRSKIQEIRTATVT